MPVEANRMKWFNEARFGLFIHWGPYALVGRGEQVLIRELMDPREYERVACGWNPSSFDPREWARVARDAGMKYAVLTARHHDGYCLWGSTHTDYNSVQQAPRRDFVREYAEAFRAAGLRVGLYYSLADFRIPAYFDGPEKDPEGWRTFRDYVHAQVHELLSNYRTIDLFWFDGAWPRSAAEWGSEELIQMMRALQPEILINNRLDAGSTAAPGEQAGVSRTLGDFGTPEHQITPDPSRAWESCQVSTWRLWGYARGERWRSADYLLDMLTEAASKAGNLLLNVGPDEDGRFPPPFIERLSEIGEWMRLNGEAIYGSEGGDITEFVTHGRQIIKGNVLYLVIRFWDGNPTLVLRGLGTRVIGATLLGGNAGLSFMQTSDELILQDLPERTPTSLLPVIKLTCQSRPQPLEGPLYTERLWCGDSTRYSVWARKRGASVNALQ